MLQAGVVFARARGLTEMTVGLTASMLDFLVETGEHEQALTLATELGIELEASGNLFDLTVVRATQALILTLRGQARQVADTLDWLETTSRDAGDVDLFVMGLGTAAIVRAAIAQTDHAEALLAEIDATPVTCDIVNYPRMLPALVRTALATTNPQLAQQLATGVEPHTPYQEHALTAAAAALAEANGDHQTAADGYTDAARRWEAFGVIPEQAFAHLGHGRCLLALDDPTADQPLRHARDLFSRLQAAPHVAECDLLLQQAIARSS